MARSFRNHPKRIALTNELHARPFQPVSAPGRLLHMAFKQEAAAAERDLAEDRAHLIALLDRFAAPHPGPDARHHAADLGRFVLKWECHTEFVAYTLFETGPTERLFAGGLIEHLDADWLEAAPGSVIAAVQIELIEATDNAAAEAMLRGPLGNAFAAESLAVGSVLDDNALAMGDFRLHEGGFSRFAIVLFGETGPRRIGRISQRLLEIEVYRVMAMLALPIARDTARRLNQIERKLSDLIGRVALDDESTSDRAILAALTEVSAEIEALAAKSAFRFGAGRAYETIVHDRIEMLREQRVTGRQQFREFILRRFDPAMRTVHAASSRLETLSLRAARAAELLRTRVNVVLESQNQRLLESMDRRAGLQLRLQETVEGFSVVAISYYAVNLAGYLLAPAARTFQIDKTWLTAVVSIPVILLVWRLIRRIRLRATAAQRDRPR